MCSFLTIKKTNDDHDEVLIKEKKNKQKKNKRFQ